MTKEYEIPLTDVPSNITPKKGDVILMKWENYYLVAVLVTDKVTSKPAGPFFSYLEAFDVAEKLANGRDILITGSTPKKGEDNESARGQS